MFLTLSSQREPSLAGTPLAKVMSSAGSLHVDPVWPRQMKAMRFSFGERCFEMLIMQNVRSPAD